MLVYQRVLQSLCTWMSNPFALLDWNILKSLMPWYVSVANGFVKSHLFAPGCYGFSSPQRLYEKVSTHPHLNPHGCCLTFPLLHIRVCVKNRAPTKTHCLKPHCGFRQTIIYWWWICPPFPVLVDTPMVAGGRDTLLDKAIQGCIILSTTCHIWGDEHPQLF